MVLTKVPSAVTAFACAACIAAAAAVPGAGSAAERIANESARLAAFTDVDAFSGIPALLDLLGGDINTLFPDDSGNPGYAVLSAVDILFGDGANGDGGVISNGNFDGLANYDVLSALPVFFGTDGVFNGGGIDALANYAALSAVPSYVALAQATSLDDAITALGGIDAYSALPVFRDIANATSLTGNSDTSVASILGGYAALSAADTFFGDGPTGQGGVFTGAGIDALAPDADGNGGYAALSALPVFFGGDNGPFGPGVFAPGGGISSLTNYAALSAIPAYVTPPAPLAASNVAPQARVQDSPTTAPLTGSGPAKTLVASLPKLPDFTPPAPPKEEPKISNPITTALSNVTPPSFNSGKQDVPEQAPVTPDTPSLPTGNQKSTLPTGKPSNGSYSGSFKPNPVLLYGSGGGNGGAENGIRGWDKVVNGIKGALGGGGDSGNSGGDGSSSGSDG